MMRNRRESKNYRNKVFKLRNIKACSLTLSSRKKRLFKSFRPSLRNLSLNPKPYRDVKANKMQARRSKKTMKNKSLRTCRWKNRALNAIKYKLAMSRTTNRNTEKHLERTCSCKNKSASSNSKYSRVPVSSP